MCNRMQKELMLLKVISLKEPFTSRELSEKLNISKNNSSITLM